MKPSLQFNVFHGRHKWRPYIQRVVGTPLPNSVGAASVVFCLFAVMISFTGIVSAQDTAQTPNSADYVFTEILSGFDNPILVTNAGDGSGRLFVAEQTGAVLVIQDGDYLFDPFLDVSALLSDDVFQGGYTERGLLGLAFHPDYANNGFVYINHTDKNGNNVIARYHVRADDPNRVDPDSRTELLQITQPFYDHNGGGIAFGKDGYLYIGVGDGGSLGDDPGVTAEDLTLPLGKILRIDVDHTQGDLPYAIPANNPFIDTPDALPEIWAYGLRNPWRFSFDRETGDLYIGDVGQAEWEEIDFQAADFPGGANYGWYWMEGNHLYRGTDAIRIKDYVAPITEYPHAIGCAVTGGYVYRGAALPELMGNYLFGDYCSGRTWILHQNADGQWVGQPLIATDRIISAFGEDEAGELYMVDYKGALLRLERAG